MVPPIVSVTVAWRWGGITKVPLKEEWLDIAVAEVTASTWAVGSDVAWGSTTRTAVSEAVAAAVSSGCVGRLQATSNKAATGISILFIRFYVYTLINQYVYISSSKAATL